MALPRGVRSRLDAEVRLWRRLSTLHLDADQAELRAAVEDMVRVRHSKLWFLLASAIIASVGLNTGSAAVIIGAMLISPLMGPIVGLGYGLAVRDRVLSFRALRYLVISVGLSLGVATLYFAASPLTEATSELLGRVRPTLLDLVVAVAAGAAGVIALGVKNAGGTIPGVAIATAIMPPLCTAGWGLASLEAPWALGGFYLFFTNAVAIAGAAYFLFRRMHVRETATGSGRRMPVPVMVGFALFLVPLGWSFLSQIVELRQKQAARAFAAEADLHHRVTSWTLLRGRPPQLVLFLLDAPGAEARSRLEGALARQIPGARLVLKTSDLSPEVKATLDQLKVQSVDAATAIARLQKAIEDERARDEARARRDEAARETARVAELERLAAEWRAFDGRVVRVAVAPAAADGTVVVAPVLEPPLRLARERQQFARRFTPWLEARLSAKVELALAP